MYAKRMAKAAQLNMTLKHYNTRFKSESIILAFVGHVFFFNIVALLRDIYCTETKNMNQVTH